MPKIKVTEKLGEYIKSLRIEYKVKANELAKNTGKSASFITKLEKAQMSSIDFKELVNIVTNVSEKIKLNDILDDIDKILDKNSIIYSKEEAKKEQWLLNFDTVLRELPIDEKLIDFINNKIIELNTDLSELVNFINENEGIKKDSNYSNINFNDYEKNFWHFNNGKSFIINELDFNNINNIIIKKTKSCNYITMYALIFHLFKMEKKNIEEAKLETLNILNGVKFYSIEEKKKVLENKKTFAEVKEVLNEFDSENINIVNKIIKHFKRISDLKVMYANEQFNGFEKNLENDIILTIRFSAINLLPLASKDINMKKDFIKDVENLVNKYAEKAVEPEEIELI